MFHQLLLQREAAGNPVRVGIIGAGKFGASLVLQLFTMRGIQAVAIADLNLDRARQAYTSCGISEEKIASVAKVEDMNKAIRERAEVARAEQLMPLELTDGVRLKQDAAKGTPIRYPMVELNEDIFLLKLRRIQDAMVF